MIKDLELTAGKRLFIEKVAILFLQPGIFIVRRTLYRIVQSLYPKALLI
jgi:hypothetical protein